MVKGRQLKPLVQGHWGSTAALAPHPTSRHLFATAGEDKLLCVWDAAGRVRRSKGRLPHMARALDWSPSGEHLAVGFVGGFLGVYDAKTLQRVAWHRRTTMDITVVR